MKLVYKFRTLRTEHLDVLCSISKKLYNQANWYIRQDFFHLENWLRYNDLDFIMKKYSQYKLLKAQTSQQILKVLDKNWKSFFNAIKEWKKDRKRFNGRPRPPKYKKGCNNILIFTNQNSKIKQDKIVLTMSHLFKELFPEFENPIEIKIPTYKNKRFGEYQQIRILPRKGFYEIEIIYKKEIETSKLDTTRYLSIDFGLNNLITTAENMNTKPIIISGRILKSINRQWNKQKARFFSIKDKQELKWTDRLDKITIRRNSIVKDYLHKTAQFIVGYCLEKQIGHICLGKLDNIKQNIRMGKRNNQNFLNIPIQKLKQMITYKARLVGIKVHDVNESYTSKCSSLDLEPIQKHQHYVGKRIKRGIFKGSNYILNADVNGALNILRKVVGDGFIQDLSDRGYWFQPVRIRDMFQTSYKQFLLESVSIS
ncbi:MAG: transposase [Candidatus Lokiarchaeota archaeon]|nr:transposase [Candidatus Lokiarchaeota archaeon]